MQCFPGCHAKKKKTCEHMRCTCCVRAKEKGVIVEVALSLFLRLKPGDKFKNRGC